MRYDTVIFDLDGTLTDSQPGIFACVRYALEKMGREVPPENILRRFVGPPLAESMVKYCGMTEQEASHAMALFRERYHPIGWKENNVYPRIRLLLKTLKDRGVSVAAATGKPEVFARKILDYFGLSPYIQAMACPALNDLHADKAALIRKVLPANASAVMVGDTASDISAAHECGIDSIAALYGYGEREELLAQTPTFVAEDTEALCALLCPEMPSPKGYFITLEGVDGCGKTTQANAVEALLRQFGYPVRRTREPGGCPIAEAIRGIVLAKEDGGMCAETEALLFAAARAQHVKEVILPAVKRGEVVLCDRFVDSSLVYQGNARGLSMDWIKTINQAALREGLPDVTVYLRMSHSEALRRRLAASDPDRIEQMGDDFQARTETAYEELLRDDPRRFLPVDAARPPEDVTAALFPQLLERMIREGVL